MRDLIVEQNSATNKAVQSGHHGHHGEIVLFHVEVESITEQEDVKEVYLVWKVALERYEKMIFVMMW